MRNLHRLVLALLASSALFVGTGVAAAHADTFYSMRCEAGWLIISDNTGEIIRLPPGSKWIYNRVTTYCDGNRVVTVHPIDDGGDGGDDGGHEPILP